MEKKWSFLPGMRQLLGSLILWALTALTLLLILSAILAKTGTGSEVLGYLSSGVSFLSALAAVALQGGGGGRWDSWRRGAVTALFLLVVLLTLGFLIGGGEPDASGILSVVSFTAAGGLLGSLLGRKRPGRRRAFPKGKRAVGRFT